MKKLLIFTSLLIVFAGIWLIIPSKSNDFEDCLDFGLCKEGLELKDNGKPFVMTKEYCIKTNHLWYEDSNTCNMRKFNN